MRPTSPDRKILDEAARTTIWARLPGSSDDKKRFVAAAEITVRRFLRHQRLKSNRHEECEAERDRFLEVSKAAKRLRKMLRAIDADSDKRLSGNDLSRL